MNFRMDDDTEETELPHFEEDDDDAVGGEDVVEEETEELIIEERPGNAPAPPAPSKPAKPAVKAPKAPSPEFTRWRDPNPIDTSTAAGQKPMPRASVDWRYPRNTISSLRPTTRKTTPNPSASRTIVVPCRSWPSKDR